MTVKEIQTMIAGTGLTNAYHHFDEGNPAKPPYIRWYFNGIDDMYADNINFQSIPELRIELYTDYKDFENENTIETALKTAGIAYDKLDSYIDKEQMYCTTYVGDVVITEEEEETNG